MIFLKRFAVNCYHVYLQAFLQLDTEIFISSFNEIVLKLSHSFSFANEQAILVVVTYEKIILLNWVQISIKHWK